jgi:uncharacterized protein (DUF1697 family)
VTTWIALLRAINVGTGRKVQMADLRALLTDAGAANVTTYIQSGNVVLDHAATSEAALRRALEPRIAERFGFAIPVIARTPAAWRAAIDANPFPDADTGTLLVAFLQDEPVDPDALDAVDRAAFAPEDAMLLGRELYLHLPDGMGRAKLPPVAGRAVGGVATARNWRTVLKLAQLAESR